MPPVNNPSTRTKNNRFVLFAVALGFGLIAAVFAWEVVLAEQNNLQRWGYTILSGLIASILYPIAGVIAFGICAILSIIAGSSIASYPKNQKLLCTALWPVVLLFWLIGTLPLAVINGI